MAKTRDYLDYLDENIDISPANSQEEFQAAQTISEVMRDHGLETSVEEFDAYSLSGAMPAILMLVMFVTLLIAGLTEGMLHFIMLLLSILSVGILLLSHYLFDVFESFGPTQRSQNVVGLHRAEGDKVTKGSRPIVIVAHYDSPRESVLRRGPLARYEATIRRGYIPCACVVVVSLFIQLLGFLPDIIRIAMWVVGLIASIPMLILAISTIIDRHASCSLGANDNKSSVAAMLSILSKVRPGEDRVTSANMARSSHRRPGDAPADSSTRRVEVVEEVKGVRHGQQVMNALGILPASCQVVYEEPKVRIVEEQLDSEKEELEDETVKAAATGALAKSEAFDDESDGDYDDYDDEYDDDGWIDEEDERDEDETSDKDDEDDLEDEDEEDEDVDKSDVEEDKLDDKGEDEENLEEEEPVEESDEEDEYDEEDYEDEDEEFDEEEDYEDSDEDDEYDEDYDEDDEWVSDEDDEETEHKGIFSRIIDWFAAKIRAIIAFFTGKKDEEEDFEIERGEDRTAYEDDEYEDGEYEDEEFDEDTYEDDAYEDDYEDEGEDVDDASDAEVVTDESYDDDELKAPVLTYRPRRQNRYEDDLPSKDDEEEVVDEQAQEPQFSVVKDEDTEQKDEETEQKDEDTDQTNEEVTYGDPRDFEYDDDEEYQDDPYGYYDKEDVYEEDTYEEESYEEESYEDAEEDAVSVRDMPEQQAPLEDAEQAYANAEPTMVGMSIADRLKGLFSGKSEKEKYSDAQQEEYAKTSEDRNEDAGDYEGQYSYEADDQSYYEGSVEKDEGYYEGGVEEDDSRYEADGNDDLYFDDEIDAAEKVPYENPYDAADAYEEDDDYYEDDYEDAYEGEYRDDYEVDELEVDDYEEDSKEETDPYENVVEEKKENEVLVQRPEDPNRLHFDREEDDDIVPRDTTGLDTISDSYDLYSDVHVEIDPTYEKPEPIDDPNWGVSSYQPARPAINIARRAALFDLPDPSAASVDPLEDDYYEDEYEDETPTSNVPREADTGTQQDTDPADVDPSMWDDKDGGVNGSGWKGGAAVRSDLRDEDGADPIIIDADDLQDAILEMGDDFLVAHDIWFVATGASRVGHAGIKAFLSEHQRDIRGAFLVNLECVGAGDLTVLTREGLHAPRRADRRLVRLLTGVAKDLHINLDTAPYDFDETDSASAMRSRIRSVTITGLDDNGLQAYSGTDDDVPENIDPKQVSSVVRLVTEMIRRS